MLLYFHICDIHLVREFQLNGDTMLKLGLSMAMVFFLAVACAEAQKLQGFVEHSEELPPVKSNFRVGADFNEQAMVKLVPKLRWYRVPPWAVGTWHVETLTNYYRHDYKTGVTDKTQVTLPFKSDQQTMGTQKDSQGDIWDYDAYPYVVDVDVEYGKQIQQIDLNELLRLTPLEMTNKLRSTNLELEKQSNRILSVYQAESLQTYSPYGKNLLRCVASVKRFDENGRPKELVQNVCAMRRISGFVPKNMFNGIDLKASFKAYLIANKLNHLVPGYLKPAP